MSGSKIRNGGKKATMDRELVKDWMTHEVVTVPTDMTLPEAHRLMTEKGIRRLPIMKNKHMVGIVTLGDVREAEPSDATSLSIWELNYLLAQLRLDQIMTRDPFTISRDATLGEAAKVMLESKVSGLPVVNSGGKVMGMITESDIFRAVVQRWGTG
jgi:CBS domain-containing protein